MSAIMRNQIIYSIYPRNFSAQGDLKSITAQLPRIKALGADIIWLMPLHPIGRQNRKGTLGSPYAISDYRDINPELGSKEDLKSLAEECHSQGLKLIIDVVYNHTSPDSVLWQQHPQWFYHKEDGRPGNRVGDWSDIIDLDYSHRELWDYQIETLKQWAAIVDGFRCDVASMVPLEFWLEAKRQVAEVNPHCLWLSESVDPQFLLDLRRRNIPVVSDVQILQAFDATYDYDGYKMWRKVLGKELSLEGFANYLNAQEWLYPEHYAKLRFVENHDQDRAASLLQGSELKNWTALSFFLHGPTLIYAGQERALSHLPNLFERDSINWQDGEDLSAFLQSLGKLKHHPVMTDSICTLKAAGGFILGQQQGRKNQGSLIGIFRVQGQETQVKIELPDGHYRNLLNDDEVEIKGGALKAELCPVVLAR
ncbi:MAG: hypothetical protein IJ228_02525 [Succinivibrio sp.]|nr:hypothetical protein [Succinivibrio sp.]